MFYVLIFSLMAVLLVVAFLSSVSRRRRNLAREEGHTSHSEEHAMHGESRVHSEDSTRRNRKAKRAQSQHDRRKRH